MAIRSTNSDRPSKAMSGTGNRGRENRDGPGNTPVDYGQGPPGRKSQKEIWDMLMEKWGPSPWFAAGAQMPWSGPDGQERGQRKPRFTPDAGDPRNAGYWKNQSTPEEIAADNAAAKRSYAEQQDLLGGDAAYTAAKAAGDLKGQIAAMTALKQRMQQQRFLDQGGSAQTWNDRFKTSWPVPRSTNGQYWYRPPGANGPNDPGLRGPTPPGVAQGGGDTADALAADMMKSRGKPDVSRETTGRTGGAGGIQGYIPTEDMPPGMTLDIPSQNILSALGSLKPTAKPTRGVRRGGGRVD